METTRHFTASMYVVNDGATALHRHERLSLWLPPGGHVDRDELPHQTALREAVEETGLDISLVQSPHGTRSDTARPIPLPANLLLEDINVHDEDVGHQHIDFIYYGESRDRQIEPLGSNEVPASRWDWVDSDQLHAADRFDQDVVEQAIDAIQTVSEL